MWELRVLAPEITGGKIHRVGTLITINLERELGMSSSHDFAFIHLSCNMLKYDLLTTHIS